MSSSPKVSVLMPAYNAAGNSKSIAAMIQAFNSLILQSYENWEALVVNDVSTDQTLEFLKSWEKQDSRIKVINSSQNQGICGAVNLAAQHATGELFARMDIDDMSAPNRFEKQVAFFEKNPDVDFVGSGMYVINELSHIVKVLIRPETHEQILAFGIGIGCPFVHGSIMMKRSLFEKIGGYPREKEFYYAEDYEMWLRVLKNGKAHNIQEPLYFYRHHDQGISKLKAKEYAEATNRVIQRFKDAFPGVTPMKTFNDLIESK
jgi:glycosyltransferase involved in cell wall biosynthesis